MESIMNSSENLSEADLEKLKKIDPGMNDIISKLLESAKETAVKESKVKKICPCSVVVGKKAALKLMEDEEKEKGLFIYSLGDQKEKIYSQCTRPTYEKGKYCWKHTQVNAEHPENVIIFEKLKESETSREADLTDGYFSNTNNKGVSKDTLNFYCTNAIKKAFAEALSEEFDEEDEQEENPDEEDEEEETPNEEEETPEEDDDEVECSEINTDDGRMLYLDPKSKAIYSPEGDDAGQEMGILMEVSGETSLKVEGKSHIVAKELEHNSKKYFRCALSDKVYQPIKNNLKMVGKAIHQKNGEYKVVMSQANKGGKKAPAKKI